VKPFRLVTYVPEGYEKKVADALFQAGAGMGNKYSNVSFRSRGTGTFKGLEGANPFIGETGKMTQAKEYRLEMLVEQQKLGMALEALHRTHPYEEVVYDLFRVDLKIGDTGLGRIGNLEQELSLKELVHTVKNQLGVDVAKVVGEPSQRIKKVALCSGSGKGLIEAFLKSDAQAFISGDLGYHDGRAVEFHGRGLIDIGHFYSEYPVVQALANRLMAAFDHRGYSIEVESYNKEMCCFWFD
jgi:hypothetical protein